MHPGEVIRHYHTYKRILVMKQFFALGAIFLMSFLMISQNAEAQRDSLRVEKEVIISADGDTVFVTHEGPRPSWRRVIISADGDTMVVTRGFREHMDITSPRHIEEDVIISADGDTIAVTKRSPRRNWRGGREREVHIEREIISADGDTITVTHEGPRRSWRGDREQEVHMEIISADGDTILVMHEGPRRSWRGDREGEVYIGQGIIVNSDGDTTVVSAVTGGDHRIRMRRAHARHQMRHRLHHRSGSRERMRGRDVHEEHGDSRELREMEVEVRRLAQQLRQADEETYSEKEEMLRAQLEKIFDHKQAMKMKELDQKRSDIEEQSKIMEERQSNREVIIKDRINQLLGRGSSYRW